MTNARDQRAAKGRAIEKTAVPNNCAFTNSTQSFKACYLTLIQRSSKRFKRTEKATLNNKRRHNLFKYASYTEQHVFSSSTKQHHLGLQSTTNVINPPTPPEPPFETKCIIHRTTCFFHHPPSNIILVCNPQRTSLTPPPPPPPPPPPTPPLKPSASSTEQHVFCHHPPNKIQLKSQKSAGPVRHPPARTTP